MILCLGMSLFDKFFPPIIDNAVVLAVGGNEDAILLCPGQDLHQITVSKAVAVGHIYLKAGDPLFLCNLSHFFQDLWVHMLEYTVESIVDYCISIGQSVVFLYLVPQTAVLRTEGHMIYNGCGSATGCRNGSGIEIIDDTGNSYIQIHVRVDIHSARKYILSFRVYYFGPGILKIGSDLTDHAFFQQKIGFIYTTLGAEHSVFNYFFHRLNFSYIWL